MSFLESLLLVDGGRHVLRRSNVIYTMHQHSSSIQTIIEGIWDRLPLPYVPENAQWLLLPS